MVTEILDHAGRKDKEQAKKLREKAKCVRFYRECAYLAASA